MASFKNGLQGLFTGKIGDLIGVKRNGQQFGRSLPRPSKKPPTYRQLNQRAKFGVAMHWLRPLKPFINIGYQNGQDNATPLNRALSYHLKEALVDTETGCRIDYPKVILSRGALVTSWVLEVIPQRDHILYIRWDNPPESRYCDPQDRMNLVFYNVQKEQYLTFENAAERSAKEVYLQMDKNFAGDTVHGWMHFVNKEGSEVSTGIYLKSSL
nr:DUF6266 family protein [Pedobacter sp. ASV19]